MNPVFRFLGNAAHAVENGIGTAVSDIGNAFWKPQADPATLNPSMPKTPVTQQLPPWIKAPIPEGNVVPYKLGPSLVDMAMQNAQQGLNRMGNNAMQWGKVFNFTPQQQVPNQAILAASTGPRIPIRVTPTPTPIPVRNPVIPAWGANQPVILKQPISPTIAEPAIRQYMQQIAPNSPMATPGATMWMAQAAAQNNLHPYLLPTLAKAETNALQPGRPDQTQLAAAIQNQNPFNVLINGKEFNYGTQGGLQYAINRYAQDIANRWQGQGWTNFRQNPNLANFVQAQNPADNTAGELQNMIQLVQQHALQRFGQ